MRDYLEAAKANGLSTPTLKQHMAAIHMLFDHLVTGAVLERNPALSVKAPRQKLGKGKTPVLTAEEAGELLRSIGTDKAAKHVKRHHTPSTLVALKIRAEVALIS